MEEEEENMSPFWIQSSRRYRRRSSSSSFVFNSGFLIVFLLIVAVAFIFFVIPSFLSFTSQIFRPNLVKKSWDSLNLVLVLFAIVCGFLSRNTANNDNIGNSGSNESTTIRSAYESESRSESFPKLNDETPRRLWYDHNGGSLNRLRSFSSYPDLRLEEASWTGRDDQWRFYDDTFYNYRNPNRDYLLSYQPQQQQRQEQTLETEDHSQFRQMQQLPPQKEKLEVKDEEKEDVKDVDSTMELEESRKEVICTPPVETASLQPISPSPPRAAETTAVVRSKVRRTYQDLGEKETVDHQNTTQRRAASPPPPESTSSPPTSYPRRPLESKVVRRKVRRTYQDVGEKEKVDNQNITQKASPPPPPQRLQPAPPPPPPPPPMFEESGRNEKKRSTSATKDFLNSLKRKKKKKQRQKSVENLDSFFNYESSYPLPSIPPPSSPPPPPPPPPPPFFQNLFSPKKRKAKKVHSVIPTPPPPPLAPARRAEKLSVSASAAKVESRNFSYASENSPLPVKIKSYTNVVEENVNSGSESPINAIPPPPPLPPFKMPAWKFEVLGDFVRLKSNLGEDVEESSSPCAGGEGATTPLFCPSPDVNTKADNFIARFRAGLRLEKMNSVKEKQGIGRSNLGPEQTPEEESRS